MKGTNLLRVALAALSLWLILAVTSLSEPPPLPAGVQGNVTLELMGQLRGSTYAVHVVGDYAYIGEGPRLVIVDISDPANPTEWAAPICCLPSYMVSMWWVTTPISPIIGVACVSSLLRTGRIPPRLASAILLAGQWTFTS